MGKTVGKQTEIVNNVLNGALDLHLHANPDAYERNQSITEVAEDARKVGMYGFAVKSHDGQSITACKVAQEMFPDVKIFGGLVLNNCVGGFNPAAVESAIKLGARIIWMPSLDSEWTVIKMTEMAQKLTTYKRLLKERTKAGLCIFENGIEGTIVKKEVLEILKLIAEADILVDTSHLSPRESLALAKAAAKIGVKRISCSHVNNPITFPTIPDLKELASLGAQLTFCNVPCLPGRAGQTYAEIAAMIREVGVANSTIITAGGAFDNPIPVDSLRMTIAHLLRQGFTESELSQMCKTNPIKLIE